MKMTRFLLLGFALTAVVSVSAFAQKPSTRRSTRTTPTKNVVATLPPLDVRAARQKVSNQLANITLFVQKLGPIAQAIEELDAEAKTKKLKKESLDKNAA